MQFSVSREIQKKILFRKIFEKWKGFNGRKFIKKGSWKDLDEMILKEERRIF